MTPADHGFSEFDKPIGPDALFDGVPYEERHPEPLQQVTSLEIPGLLAAVEAYNRHIRGLELSEITGIQDIGLLVDATDEEIERAIQNNKVFGIKAEGRIESLKNLRDELVELLQQAGEDI